MNETSQMEQGREWERQLKRECRVERSVGSGPGGQHRNRTESRIVLVHLPTGIRVTCEDTPSQHRNLRRALEILRQKLAERAMVRKVRKKQVGRLWRVKQKILADKKRRSKRKQERRKPNSTD